jgi:hypothetical protein
MNDGESVSGPNQDNFVVETDGASDDDSQGDPGDSGDGYGITDNPGQADPPGGVGNGNSMIIDEFMLILMSLVQLAL